MMIPGDEKIVADRLLAVLSKPPKIEPVKTAGGPPASLAGQWDLRLEFNRDFADHTLVFEQQDTTLVGTHRGEFVTGDLRGTVSGNAVRFRSSQKIEGTRLSYDFTGEVSGENMRGTVEMGEYGKSNWTARRHTYRTPGGVVRPVKTA
jgi:L-seryl-tRNA(Ser) seleniumtransferase